MPLKKRKQFLKSGYLERKEQERLRAQYEVEENDVLVVERKSRVVQLWKVTLHASFVILRVLVNILIAVLATIGLATLIFPDIRSEFLAAGMRTLNEIRSYIQF